MSVRGCFTNRISNPSKAYKVDIKTPMLHARKRKVQERTEVRTDHGGREEVLGSLGPALCDGISSRGCLICPLNPRCQEGEGEGELRDRTADFLISACYMVFLFPSSGKIIWMMTFIAAIVLGLDIGLLVSVAFAFFMITIQSHRYLVSGNRSLAMAGKATRT